MTALHPLTDLELHRLRALLDRMDPQPGTCQVAGCTHIHGAHDHAESLAA